MDRFYLLEKIYDKYQMEIGRKDRLENKSIGYYTIIGIFFAGFLVIEPILLSTGYLVKVSIKELITILNYFLIFSYLIVFVTTIIILHKNYQPKRRPEFDPIQNWDALIALNEDDSIESIKCELINIISYYEEKNDSLSRNLTIVNKCCIICAVITVMVFFMLIAVYPK